MRNSGKALRGPLLQHGEVRLSNRCPRSLPKGGRADSLYGVRVGVCAGVRLEGWLRGSAHPFVVLCAGGMRRTLLLLLAPHKWQLGFFGLFVYNLPQLRMHTVIFSPL